MTHDTPTNSPRLPLEVVSYQTRKQNGSYRSPTERNPHLQRSWQGMFNASSRPRRSFLIPHPQTVGRMAYSSLRVCSMTSSQTTRDIPVSPHTSRVCSSGCQRFPHHRQGGDSRSSGPTRTRVRIHCFAVNTSCTAHLRIYRRARWCIVGPVSTPCRHSRQASRQF